MLMEYIINHIGTSLVCVVVMFVPWLPLCICGHAKTKSESHNLTITSIATSSLDLSSLLVDYT